MADDDFQVVFRGEITGELPEGEVKQRLAALFKMPAAKVDGLFSGKPIVVKRNLDEATARKFEGAFRKAGAKCVIQSAGGAGSGAAAEPSAGAAQSREVPPATGKARPSMAAAGDPNQTLLDMEVPADLAGLEVDASEAPLSKGGPTPEPDIDIGGLSVSRDDSGNLAESKPAPPADIDTGNLSLEDADD